MFLPHPFRDGTDGSRWQCDCAAAAAAASAATDSEDKHSLSDGRASKPSPAFSPFSAIPAGGTKHKQQRASCSPVASGSSAVSLAGSGCQPELPLKPMFDRPWLPVRTSVDCRYEHLWFTMVICMGICTQSPMPRYRVPLAKSRCF